MYDNIFYCKCRAAKVIESVLVCPLWASAFSWLSNINNKKKNQRMETKLLVLVSVYNIAGILLSVQTLSGCLYLLIALGRMDLCMQVSLSALHHSCQCMGPSACGRPFVCLHVAEWIGDCAQSENGQTPLDQMNDNGVQHWGGLLLHTQRSVPWLTSALTLSPTVPHVFPWDR